MRGMRKYEGPEHPVVWEYHIEFPGVPVQVITGSVHEAVSCLLRLRTVHNQQHGVTAWTTPRS